jgi:hypothetical protein
VAEPGADGVDVDACTKKMRGGWSARQILYQSQ